MLRWQDYNNMDSEQTVCNMNGIRVAPGINYRLVIVDMAKNPHMSYNSTIFYYLTDYSGLKRIPLPPII
jgi:hypothetical protein